MAVVNLTNGWERSHYDVKVPVYLDTVTGLVEVRGVTASWNRTDGTDLIVGTNDRTGGTRLTITEPVSASSYFDWGWHPLPATWVTYAVDIPQAVTRVKFVGTAQEDVFDNRTSIPSEADSGGGNDRLLGGSGVDVLIGGDMDDYLEGRLGSDQLLGSPGHDTIFGGEDSDWIWGGPGNDILDGGASADILYGEQGNDTLYGRGGNDALLGGSERDSLFGGDDNDYLAGEAGNDSLYGEGGHDTLLGGESIIRQRTGGSTSGGFSAYGSVWGLTSTFASSIFASALTTGITEAEKTALLSGQFLGENLTWFSQDRILVNAGVFSRWTNLGNPNDFDVLDGGALHDLLIGSAATDRLLGGRGSDQMFAGLGNDYLDPGASGAFDRVYSGSGSDSVVYGHWVLASSRYGDFYFQRQVRAYYSPNDEVGDISVNDVYVWDTWFYEGNG